MWNNGISFVNFIESFLLDLFDFLCFRDFLEVNFLIFSFFLEIDIVDILFFDCLFAGLFGRNLFLIILGMEGLLSFFDFDLDFNFFEDFLILVLLLLSSLFWVFLREL